MSESLLSTVKRLADLESKVSYPYLVYVLPEMKTPAAGKTDADARFIHDMRMAAPKLLDVLGQFEAGDAAQIATIMRQMQSWYGEDRTPGCEERMKLLARMQKMASLMEANHDL